MRVAQGRSTPTMRVSTPGSPLPKRRGLLALVLTFATSALHALSVTSGPARADDAPPRPLVSQKVVVKKGDTLGTIASRNGVKVTDLRRWNRGRIGKGDAIRAGATLIVKVPADKADPALVPGAKATDNAGNVTKKGGVAASKPAERPPNTWEDQVRVRRGDSLSRIAARIDVAVDDLLAWNRLTLKSKLRAGQTLTVYRAGTRPAPQSVGRPTAGALEYGLHLGEGPGYRLRFPKNAYAVEGVLKTLRACARRVRDAFPGTHDILIGDLSRPGGGRFAPHASHQSGRDADVGYYLASNLQNETMHRVKAADVDYAKTWAHLKCHLTTDRVSRVYMDRRIQIGMIEWLRKKKTVDDGQIQRLFEVEGGEEALVRHAKEHDTHFHVRFACDAGQSGCVEEEGEEAFDF